jgi:hypothetical protein
MLLFIDIFSINKVRGYENPSLEIIVIEHFLNRGFPLEEAHEHFFLNQSAIYVVVLISFMCYFGDYAGYITVILPFLSFYFHSSYLLYLVSYIVSRITECMSENGHGVIDWITEFVFGITLNSLSRNGPMVVSPYFPLISSFA